MPDRQARQKSRENNGGANRIFLAVPLATECVRWALEFQAILLECPGPGSFAAPLDGADFAIDFVAVMDAFKSDRHLARAVFGAAIFGGEVDRRGLSGLVFQWCVRGDRIAFQLAPAKRDVCRDEDTTVGQRIPGVAGAS